MIPITPIVPGFDLPYVVYAKDQPEYIPLPALRDDDGTILTRWKLSWKERLQVLFGGSLWLTILTHNHPLQPVKLSTECPVDLCRACIEEEEALLSALEF